MHRHWLQTMRARLLLVNAVNRRVAAVKCPPVGHHEAAEAHPLLQGLLQQLLALARGHPGDFPVRAYGRGRL